MNINEFLNHLKNTYYNGKDFSSTLSDKLIKTMRSFNNLDNAISFFYDNEESIAEALESSNAQFSNIGQKFSYLLGIWKRSYINGEVQVARTSNEDIIKALKEKQ